MASTVSKANFGGIAGGVVTLAALFIAKWTGAVDTPPDATAVSEAVTAILVGVGGFISTWLTVYLAPKNS